MGGLELQDVTRRCTTQVLVDFGDYRPGTYLVQIIVRRQALDRFAIEPSIDVFGDLFAVVCWTLRSLLRCVLTTKGV